MTQTTEKLPENLSLNSDQQKEFNQKLNQIKQKGKDEVKRGVVYIGHIPHGFFEGQMKHYFSQFGKVCRLRIARSKKTGNIKGYAFVEFESDIVAKVVADSMNNYLMFHRLLKCELIPEEKVHPETFKGSDRAFSRPKAHILSKHRHNRKRAEEEEIKLKKQQAHKLQKSLNKIKNRGIDYDFKLPAVSDPLTPIVPDDIEVLYEDSSEDEISFRTPPNSIKSSKLKSGASTGAAQASSKYRDTRTTDTPVTTVADKNSKMKLRKRKADKEKVQEIEKVKISIKRVKKTPVSKKKKVK